jgi:hypothetical protein
MFVALFSLQGFPVTPAPTARASPFEPESVLVVYYPCGACRGDTRAMLVAIAMGVVAGNKRGGVSMA